MCLLLCVFGKHDAHTDCQRSLSLVVINKYIVHIWIRPVCCVVCMLWALCHFVYTCIEVY